MTKVNYPMSMPPTAAKHVCQWPAKTA